MSEEAKQPVEESEVVRKLSPPPESPMERKDGDRSPTKTERDLTTEAIAEADAATTSSKGEVVRELLIPEPQLKSEEGD
jgi:hypothetical protein